MEKTQKIEYLISRLEMRLKRVSEENGLHPSNLLFIVLQLMQLSSTYKELDGLDKKLAVTTALERFVKTNDTMDEMEKEQLSLLLSITVSEAIDLFHSIDKGKLSTKIKKLCCFSTKEIEE